MDGGNNVAVVAGVDVIHGVDGKFAIVRTQTFKIVNSDGVDHNLPCTILQAYCDIWHWWESTGNRTPKCTGNVAV